MVLIHTCCTAPARLCDAPGLRRRSRSRCFTHNMRARMCLWKREDRGEPRDPGMEGSAGDGGRGWGGGDLTGRALSYLPKVVSHLTLRPSRQVGEMHALCRYSAGGPTAAAYRWVTSTAGL